MIITIAFTACIQWHCWWQTTQQWYSDTMHTVGGVTYHKPLTDYNCNQWALSEIRRDDKSYIVADKLELGMNNIKIVPTTVQCWPLKKGPQ
jgi:hypothetical protein